MLKLNPIGSNMTELQLDDVTILFNYSTPVACWKHRELGRSVPYRTSQKHSVTTTKHINKWFNGTSANEESQEFFDNLTI